jgi:hypothetical protein
MLLRPLILFALATVGLCAEVSHPDRMQSSLPEREVTVTFDARSDHTSLGPRDRVRQRGEARTGRFG